MSEGISIQKLIDQVRKELLEPTKVSEYPIFLVDNVELELNVAITKDASGEIAISVLNTLSGKLGGEEAQQKSHTIKVTLSPMIPPEEIRKLISEELRKKIIRATKMALVKGGDDTEDVEYMADW